MVEPTAHQALLSLADELEAIATGSVPHSPAAGAYTHAARLARDHAAVLAETPGGPGTPLGEGETSREPDGALRAAADAINAEMGGPAEGEPWTLARVALAAGEPFIRTDAVKAERARILAGAEVLKTILTRPGYGSGPEHSENTGVVPWDKLANLIQGEKP